jgi:hypothetical protein
MTFPLSLDEISLWLAVVGILLLLTSEVIKSNKEINLLLNTKRLRTISLLIIAIFLVTVIIKVYEMLIYSSV